MINEEDRIASLLVWCAPPPPPATPPPPAAPSDGRHKTVRVTNSRDPNEKAGPDGFGPERYIEGDEPLPYVVRFENVASATAPAQVVRITDQLDPSEVRLASVSLGPVQFGDTFAGPPPGLQALDHRHRPAARSRTWSSASRRDLEREPGC